MYINNKLTCHTKYFIDKADKLSPLKLNLNITSTMRIVFKSSYRFVPLIYVGIET